MKPPIAIPWTIDEKHHYPILDEIEKQADRGAAIMSAAFLEDFLVRAIETRLYIDTEYNKARGKALCGINGPLGSFGSRIDAGLLLGLYLDETHHDLLTIAIIRNYFAHRSRALDFNHRDMRRACRDLILIRRIAHSQMPQVMQMKGGAPPPKISFDEISAFVNKQGFRWQFIRTVQIIIGLLIAQIHRPPPLPPKPTRF
jgi:hypothetical protein